MRILKILMLIILLAYLAVLLLAFLFQRKMIFYPDRLAKDYRFMLNKNGEEVFFRTKDGEELNGLFFRGSTDNVVLYFHGNQGDLRSWQFVAEDFTSKGYNFFIIDYRGYGKSSGTITEQGLYEDAEAAYQFIVDRKSILPQNIIIYGRSIGTGVAVHLAARHAVKGLVLESPYSSLTALVNQKMPFFLPSLILRYRFDSISKIDSVKSPVLFLHGSQDELIPMSHTQLLFDKFEGRKHKVIVKGGAHNDLADFAEYHDALIKVVPGLFADENNAAIHK